MRTLLAYTLLAAILTISAAAGAFYSPTTAQADITTPISNLPPATRMPVLTIAMNQINDIRDMAYSDWETEYQDTRVNPRYAWMDWSNDGCSGPDWAKGVKRYADTAYTAACLRHDYTWRTLAVIDQGTGRIWNERNRWVADETFQKDAYRGCDAAYPQDEEWPNESNFGCRGAVDIAYTLIRSWQYDPNRNSAEEKSTKAKPEDYIPFPSATARIDCGAAGSSNRCLPIHYLEVSGRPLNPRNTPYIAQSRVIKMYTVRANLQAPDGAPIRTFRSVGQYKPTGELAIKVNWPLRASTVESAAVCPSLPRSQGEQTVYVNHDTYVPNVTPADDDDELKKVPFYVIACATTTDDHEESELLKFNRMEARYLPSARAFQTTVGDQVRTYEQIHSESCPTRAMAAAFTVDQANAITLSSSGEGYSYGSWIASDCKYPTTTFYPYIDYHVFTPEETTKAVIDLEYRGKPVDPDLYLYFITRDTGALRILDLDNDNGDGNSKNARITQALFPGTRYVAGATLRRNGSVGDYRLRIGTTPACIINPIARDSNQTSRFISGTWTTMDCISSRRANSYADHYSFELGGTQDRTVNIDVRSADANPYIFLVRGDSTEGSSYLYKKNNRPNYVNRSIISESLSPGPYIIIVSTYAEHKTGDYSLRISGLDRGR